jgi:Ca-activated chloride channel family protein
VYEEIEENPFVEVADTPISTFSIDADGASYANVRRFLLDEARFPLKDAIRTEEMINYFELDYPSDDPTHPLTLHGEVSSCPWKPENKLIRIGMKGKSIPTNQLPPSNFVFLIDVSGSMSGKDKLGLLKDGFVLFVEQLDAEDRVAIVTYAGQSEIALESTPGDDKKTINKAIRKLGSGGGTAGEAGITAAYEIALANFIPGGNNRIILGTDGDFNVGISDKEELIELIEEKRESDVFLTVLGVGRGNLNDATLEQIANHGNGTYEYLDKLEQLKKVFLYEFSKFYPIAKDVKVQVEFNPANVSSYRLIGYENRLLQTEDFEDDAKDAGEIGANQNITAFYEIVPVPHPGFKDVPTFTIDVRYKEPDSDVSQPMEVQIFDQGTDFAQASDHQQFLSSVAAFSMVLRDSPYKGSSSYSSVLDWLNQVYLPDPHGFQAEFREMVETAQGF